MSVYSTFNGKEILMLEHTFGGWIIVWGTVTNDYKQISAQTQLLYKKININTR